MVGSLTGKEFKNQCDRKNNTLIPQSCPGLILGTWDYATLHVQRNFADMIKVKDIRVGQLHFRFGWALCKHTNSLKGRTFYGCVERELWPWKNSKMDIILLGLKMDEEDHKSRNVKTSINWKRQKNRPSSRVSRDECSSAKTLNLAQ